MGIAGEDLVAAAQDRGVGHTELRVLVGISPRVVAGRWEPVAAGQLGRQLHLRRETTARALGKLVAGGWLCSGPRAGRVNTYRPGPRCQVLPDTSNLSPTAARLVPVVTGQLGAEADHPVNHSALADWLGISRGAMVVAMGQLVTAGVILRGPRCGRVHTYRLPRSTTPSKPIGSITTSGTSGWVCLG